MVDWQNVKKKGGGHSRHSRAQRVTPRNSDRVVWGASALISFAQLLNTGADLATEPQIVLVDLLADLMHWCDVEEIDFEHVVERARCHYIEESRRK